MQFQCVPIALRQVRNWIQAWVQISAISIYINNIISGFEVPDMINL